MDKCPRGCPCENSFICEPYLTVMCQIGGYPSQEVTLLYSIAASGRIKECSLNLNKIYFHIFVLYWLEFGFIHSFEPWLTFHTIRSIFVILVICIRNIQYFIQILKRNKDTSVFHTRNSLELSIELLFLS